jgi:hypothetical protein
MRRMVLVGIILAATVVLGVGVPVASASAFVQDVPYNVNGILNPCNGEVVAVTGVEHVVMNTTPTPAGGLEVSDQVIIRGMGSGDLGNTYTLHNNSGVQEHFQVSGATTFTFPQTFTLISEGSAPNFTIHVMFHATVNPAGTVTAFIDTFTTVCEG